jgi:hypothetical protein
MHVARYSIAMGTLVVWAYLIALVSSLTCGQPAPKQEIVLRPPARCMPESTKSTYVVCVVDEAGRGVAGAKVEAVREQMGEGYGDVGFWDDKLGVVTTDAYGRAAFAVPPIKQGWLWSAKEFRRWSTATVSGWPARPGDESGTIVVGPPRSITLRTRKRMCDGKAWISIDDATVTEVTPGTFTALVGAGPHVYATSWCEDSHDVSTNGSVADGAGVIDIP